MALGIKNNRMNNLLLLLCIYLSFDASSQDLYAINEDGKWGYINVKGEVVVPAIYEVVGDFHDGLAPVRLDNEYGYIDSTGALIVPFQFEFADNFAFGHARVLQQGAYYLIDNQGNVILDLEFDQIKSRMNNPYTLNVGGVDFKSWGAINLQKELILDTVWSNVRWVGEENEYAIVSQWEPYLRGVFDSFGKEVIPVEKYNSIELINGFGWKATDTLGNCFILSENGTVLLDGANYGNYFGVSTPMSNDDPLVIGFGYQKGSCAVNKKGKVIFSLENCKQLLPFNNGRSAYKGPDNLWYIIDTEGNVIGDRGYNCINNVSNGFIRKQKQYLFYDDTELVARGNTWYRIDKNGKTLDCEECKNILKVENRIENYYVVQTRFRNDTCFNAASGTFYPKSRFYDLRNMRSIDARLVTFAEDDYVGYRNEEGIVVWQKEFLHREKREPNNFSPDHSFVWSYYGREPLGEQDILLFGEEIAEKACKPMDSMGFTPPTSGLGIYIDTLSKGTQDGFNTYHTYIYNAGQESVDINTIDNDLYVDIELKNREGKWVKVTYSIFTGCGNSYYTEELPAGYCWKMHTPIFEGPHKTQMRLVLDDKAMTEPIDVNIHPALLRNSSVHNHAILSYRLR